MSPDDPHTQRDHELGERYLRGELDEQQRDAFERRLLEEDALFEDVRALELAALALGSASATPVARARRAAPAWLGWAAALLLSLPAALWITGRVRPRPPVTRAPQETRGPVAIEALLDLDVPSARLPRARTLVSLPAPQLDTGDVLRAELSGPRGERPGGGLVMSVVAGRARLLVDARELSPGPWRLELRWSDAAGRALGTRAYELRVE